MHKAHYSWRNITSYRCQPICQSFCYNGELWKSTRNNVVTCHVYSGAWLNVNLQWSWGNPHFTVNVEEKMTVPRKTFSECSAAVPLQWEITQWLELFLTNGGCKMFNVTNFVSSVWWPVCWRCLVAQHVLFNFYFQRIDWHLKLAVSMRFVSASRVSCKFLVHWALLLDISSSWSARYKRMVTRNQFRHSHLFKNRIISLLIPCNTQLVLCKSFHALLLDST